MTNKNSGIITVTAMSYARRVRRTGGCSCWHCGHKFKIGDRVYSRSATLRWPGSAYKWYCLGPCAVDLNYIEEEELIA